MSAPPPEEPSAAGDLQPVYLSHIILGVQGESGESGCLQGTRLDLFWEVKKEEFFICF